MVLVSIALLMTIGVYGLVAMIVKLDDVGLYLSRRPGRGGLQALGRGVVAAAPVLMKGLAIAGTAAMFLVGGGILAHGIPGLEPWFHHFTDGLGPAPEVLLSLLLNGAVGVIAGAAAYAVVAVVRRRRA